MYVLVSCTALDVPQLPLMRIMKYALSRYIALGIVGCFAADVLAFDYSSTVSVVPVPGSGSKIDFLGDTFEEDGWKFWQ